LLSFIVTVYADCGTYVALTLTPCLLSSTPCQCWTDYVQNQQSQCTLDDTISIFESCKIRCNNLYFDIIPSTCLDATTVFATCQLNLLNTDKSVCDCYTDYVQHSDGVCLSNDEKITQWSTCALAKAGCANLDCPLDCQLLNDLIPDTRTTFETCWTNNTDKCSCYTAAVDKIVDFEGCDTAVTLKLETCVQTQLDCDTLQGTEQCKAIDVTLSISTIKALLDQNVEKFRVAWNNGFAKLNKAITVDTVTHESDGENTISLTLTVTYSSDLPTLISDIIQELSCTIGLKAEDMQGKEVESSKRGVLSTSTIQITGKENGSGASGLTIVLLPLVALISAIHYYF